MNKRKLLLKDKHILRLTPIIEVVFVSMLAQIIWSTRRPRSVKVLLDIQ